MSKVVYLLGAGASCGVKGDLPIPVFSADDSPLPQGFLGGLPTLKDFSKAVRQLQDKIWNFNAIDISTKDLIVHHILDDLYQICEEYPTIDTYSKILYTTRQQNKYYKFKFQLTLFFLLWQRAVKHDLRYDSFISSVSDAETGVLSPMTILTWNYDSQFEIAYSRFASKDMSVWDVWKSLNVYCKSYEIANDHSDKNKFAVIKLNGTALIHGAGKDDHNACSFMRNGFIWSKSPEQLINNLCAIYKEMEHNNFLSDLCVNDLSYAWEKTGMEVLKRKIKDRCSNCEVLVVIGYSFPYVNREIDRYLFQKMRKLKKIYVQDKEPEVIKERIAAIYEFFKKDTPPIVSREIGDTFFIPNELG